jgi:hypothetical protein
MPVKVSKPTNGRCKGTTRSGVPCTAWATEGGLCFFHANPTKTRLLGRAGGRKNRHFPQDPAAQGVRPPRTAAETRDLLGETAAAVRNSELDPRLATAVAYVCGALLKAIQLADLERKLEALERKVAEAKDSESTNVEADGYG